MPEEEEKRTDPQKAEMLGRGDPDAEAAIAAATAAESDTDTETDAPEGTPPEEAPDTETETDEGSEQSVLTKYGLDRYGTVDAALAGIQEKDRFIDELKEGGRQMREVLKSYTKQPAPTEERPEPLDFNADVDPDAALQKAGYVRQDQVQPSFARVDERLAQTEGYLQRMAFADAVGQFDELKDVVPQLRTGQLPIPGRNKLWDEMGRVYQSAPGLQAVDPSQIVPILYDAAQKRMGAPPAVAPVSAEKKRGATTTSAGRREAGLPYLSDGTPDFNDEKWTDTKIYNWHEERDLIS